MLQRACAGKRGFAIGHRQYDGLNDQDRHIHDRRQRHQPGGIKQPLHKQPVALAEVPPPNTDLQRIVCGLSAAQGVTDQVIKTGNLWHIGPGLPGLLRRRDRIRITLHLRQRLTQQRISMRRRHPNFNPAQAG